jgi:hypothetical protein
MNQAPEGLDYGTTNKAHKYDTTPINDEWKEKGKIETGGSIKECDLPCWGKGK